MMQPVQIRLMMDPGNVPQASKQAAQAISQIGQAGVISARQTAAAMRQLPAQFTDIATQLAGGQNPLLILLQQGGQIKDSFGGIGPAIRAVGAAISPVALGIGALAAVGGTLGLAFFQGQKQGEALRDTIALTGNAAGLTAGRLDALAASVADSTGQTVGSAREIAMALAASGTVSSAAIDSTAHAVARVADVSGKESASIAKDFSTMSGGVAKWAAEHNKAWNFITAEQYKYIKRLEDQGKAEQAMIEVNTLVIKHLADQQRNLGTLERAWDFVSKAASGAWNAMLGAGKADTVEDRIAAATSAAAGLQKQLAQNRARGFGDADPYKIGSVNSGLEAQVKAAQATIFNLIKERDNAAIGAESKGESARREREKIAKLTGSGGKDRPATPKYDALGGFIDDQINAQTRRDEQASERDLREKERAAERDLREKEQLLDRDAGFLQSLVDANAKANIALVQDDETRGQLQIELERSIMQRRVAMMGLTGQALEESVRLIEERAQLARDGLHDELRKKGAEQTKQLGDGTYDDVRGALQAAFRDSSNPAKAFASALGNAIFTRVTAGLADALATAAVGKSGGGGLWGDLLGLIGSVAGGGYSVDPSGVSTNNTGGSLPTRGGMATGTNFVPRDMFALLHRGEAVVPAKYNHAQAGGAGHQEVHYHVPPGQSPASFAALLSDNNRRLKAEIQADAARPGRGLNNAIAAGAV